jgi:isoleucyl-tRNA synthetase
MADYNSVHLQNFPDVSNIFIDKDLVEEMDLVRSICSVAFFLRDKQNLRVRLPLKSIRIIGNGANSLEKYKSIIADEINVKEVFFEEKLEDFADFIIEINLKLLGAKYGEKLKNIINFVKSGKWQKDGDNVVVGNNYAILEPTEYVLKLVSKNGESDNIKSLPNNKMLIDVDFSITEELELEGIARDMIRNIQQMRKDKGFDISDRINLTIKTNDEKIVSAINNNIEYIKEQTLSLELVVKTDSNEFSIEIVNV